jgi:SAM-dependent methyltransferase
LLPPDPLATRPLLAERSAALRGARRDRLAEVDTAIAALRAEGRLRPDQQDYAARHRARFAEAAEAIARSLGPHPAWPRCRVLEVGSSITPMLYRRLFPDLRLASACLFRHPQLDGVVEEAVQVDLEKLDLREGPALPLRGLDMVMLCEVLEHLVVSPANLFRALAGSLGPGGVLYVTTPNFFRQAARAALAAGRNPQPIIPEGAAPAERFHHHVREYAMAELLAAMEAAGLAVEAAYYSDCWDDPSRAAAMPADALGNLVIMGRLPGTPVADAQPVPAPAAPAPLPTPAPAMPVAVAAPAGPPPRPARYRLLDLAARNGAKRLARPDGLPYMQVLGLLHRALPGRRYIEIGVRSGASLALARNRAIGVDPALDLVPQAVRDRPGTQLFAMTSDDFFAAHNPRTLLGGRLDLAFVDGMHHHEFVVRDVMNCEAQMRPEGAIVLHDILPQSIAIARRLALLPNGEFESFEGAWTGDVWRVLRVLRRWRPELRITVLDAPPTGLAVLTGLDPASTVLRDNLAAILAEEEAAGNTEDGWWEQVRGIELVNTRRLADPAALREAIGLPPAPARP